jgi:DNA invertase Pin-like site-specific DNA recombinase
MKYGYTRVSTDDQTPALQLAALKKPDARLTYFLSNAVTIFADGFRIPQAIKVSLPVCRILG